MNKKIKLLNKRDFTEFADKVSAKWQLRIQHTDDTGTGSSTEAILRDLVAIPTVTGNYEANHEAFDRIEHFLSERGMRVKRYEWNGIESMVATTRPTKTPTVCFLGHIDVVPAPEESFQLQERDGRYYGRGVVDMKSGVAAFLGTVNELRDNIEDYDFGIMLTSDEEVGGFDGAQKLADEIGYLPKVIVVPDGGSNWNLERFAKGIWHLTIEATGSSAHGSRPWEGENAIDKLMESIAEIKMLFPAEPNINTSTINLGIVQGGEAINQIPGTATASLDMRFITSREQAKIMRKIEAIIERRHLNLISEVEANAVENDPQNEYLIAYAKATEEVIGRPPEWIISNAGNDSRFFAKYGVPTANAYPAGGNHHGPGEYIEKDALLMLQEIFVRHLNKVARKPATSKGKARLSAKN